MKQMIGIIGSRGFLGSHLRRAYGERTGVEVIDVDTRQAGRGNMYPLFDRVYFCAGNSRVYLSAQRPQECLQRSVVDLIDYLTTLRYAKFILMSSWMVYPMDEPDKTESLPIDLNRLSPYGANKYLAEFYVRSYAPAHVIFRPTGFFGPGLRKNPLYDLKHRALVYRISRDSYEDFMHVDRFCQAVMFLSEELTNATLNIGSGFPIAARELVELAPSGFRLEEPLQPVDCRTLNLTELHRHTRLYASAGELRNEMFQFLGWQPVGVS